MKKNTVLVVASGGKFRLGFIEALTKLSDHVVVLDCFDNKKLDYPKGSEPIFVENFNDRSVFETVNRLSEKYNITAVGTLYEDALEVSAKIREHLKLPGFTYEKILYSRNKGLMYQMLHDGDVKVPPFKLFKQDDSREKILAVSEKLKAPFVIKPATGGANVGLRLVRSHDEFWDLYQEAFVEAKDYHGIEYSTINMAAEWMICEYVGGKEVEVDIYVDEGDIGFRFIQEKPMIFEHGNIIEENSAISPPLTLSEKQIAGIEKATKKLTRLVFDELAKPCGVKYFTLYPEYKVDEEGNCTCLEFTIRVGGGISPLIVPLSSGVNMLEVAARSVVGLRSEIRPKIPHDAVYWQILYSDRPGIYRGLEGLNNVDGIKVIHGMTEGIEIKTPHGDYLAYIYAQAKTPREALETVANALKKASILVEVNGQIERAKLPIPTDFV